MSQRTVLAAVAGAIALFVLGYLVYALALADFFAAQGADTLESPNLVYIFIGELAFAVLLTFLFSYWASISTFAGGFKGGAIVGALVSLSMGMIMMGAMGMGTPIGVVADVVASIVRVGIAGGVIGAMLGRS